MHNNTLLPVQYLRAVAALAVYYFHFYVVRHGSYEANDPPIEQIGSAGVDLFFVISGFIMAMLVWNRQTTFSGFMRDRLIRIVPLYWVGTLVVFGIALLIPTLLGSTQADPFQLLHSLFFIPYGVGEVSSVPTLLVGWTLNYEMFFYLLVAISVGFANDRSLLRTSGVICALVALGVVINPQNRYLEFYLDPIILEFPMGILVYHFWRLSPGGINKAVSVALFTASIAAIIVLFNKDAAQFRYIFWGMPTALLLFASLQVITFRSKFLKALGDWSYSIYLLHVFVIMGFHKLIGPALSLETLPWPVYFSLVTLVLVGVSAVSYYCFEKPVQNWLKARLQPNRPTMSVSALVEQRRPRWV